MVAEAALATVARPLDAAAVARALAPLIAAGHVIDAEAPPRPVAAVASGLERVELAAGQTLRLVVAPGVGLDCDGRGGCCRLYDRVGLSAADAARIAECYGDDERTPGGLYVASAVVPERADEDELGL